MSGFHEVRFPDNIAYGATGGPEFGPRWWRPEAATRSATSIGPRRAAAGVTHAWKLSASNVGRMASHLP